MVTHLANYRWSSYRHNAIGETDVLITLLPLYSALGEDDEQRLYSYRELFRMHIEHTEIHNIREALIQELVLGREDIKDRIEQMTKRQTRPGQQGRPRIGENTAIYYVI